MDWTSRNRLRRGNDLALTTHGHQVAIGGSDGKIYQYDADTGAPIGAPLTGHAGSGEMVAYSGDGSNTSSAPAIGRSTCKKKDLLNSPRDCPGSHRAAALPAAVSPDGWVRGLHP